MLSEAEAIHNRQNDNNLGALNVLAMEFKRFSEDDMTKDLIDGTFSNELNRPQHLEIAGRFILAFIQALLRTGYYLPGHPESSKAKKGIYGYFTHLSNKSGEVTLYISEEKGKRIVLIEGIDDTPIKLNSIMQLGMAETYMPRIILFLERKELASITLKNGLKEIEFCQFIDILSEPPDSNLDSVATREQFIRDLKKFNILNISCVFREDIISSRSTLPWRVRLALSRLKKDLHLIPILRNLEEEELHQVKMRVLTDILRPLVYPKFAYSFLLNLDLAASSLLNEEEAEQHFFEIASENLILEVARLFMNDLIVNPMLPEHVTSVKTSRLQAGFCHQLSHTEDYKSANLLEEYFNYGLVAFEALPEFLRIRIEKIKRMGVFLNQSDRFITAFDNIADISTYSSRSKILSSFVPILLEREHFVEALTIIEMFSKHIQEHSNRTPIAVECIAEIAHGESLAHASSIFLTASKETRTVISRIFSLIGSESVQHMLNILINSSDSWKCKQAAETLITMGESAVTGLITAVENNQINKTTLAAVLRVISDGIPIDQRISAVKMFKKLVQSSCTEIRSEVITGLGRIGAVGNFIIFKKYCEDIDTHIRKASIIGIGRAEDPRGTALLISVIEKAMKNGKEEEIEIATTAIEALGSLMTSCPATYDQGFEYLTTLVDQSSKRSSWKKLLFGSAAISESIVRALFVVFGRLHSELATKQLLKLEQIHSLPEIKQVVNQPVDCHCHL